MENNETNPTIINCDENDICYECLFFDRQDEYCNLYSVNNLDAQKSKHKCCKIKRIIIQYNE
ncbi:MAG TPA: hypothetical protein VI911_08705 [Patescibacteria group bacterium]|nr:MAG: hypothetical protein UR43_C0005G0091 [candidate division TM6 bacterium GW2011_GWF2_33_332]HLD91076.1 hypothetical protein [Patescibacteria group bacterium]